VFVQSGQVWTQQQELTASDGAAKDSFAFPFDERGNGRDRGSWQQWFARRRVRLCAQCGVWGQQGKLTASDGRRATVSVIPYR